MFVLAHVDELVRIAEEGLHFVETGVTVSGHVDSRLVCRFEPKHGVVDVSRVRARLEAVIQENIPKQVEPLLVEGLKGFPYLECDVSL